MAGVGQQQRRMCRTPSVILQKFDGLNMSGGFCMPIHRLLMSDGPATRCVMAVYRQEGISSRGTSDDARDGPRQGDAWAGAHAS